MVVNKLVTHGAEDLVTQGAEDLVTQGAEDLVTQGAEDLEAMAETKVICPECGKEVSLRGLNGHLRFDHEYDLENAKKMAAGFNVDGALSRLEQDVMKQVKRLFHLKTEAEDLRRALEEGVIGEALYERMITQKGQELTAATRYLQRLEQSWSQRIGERTGVSPNSDVAIDVDAEGLEALIGKE